MGLRVDKLSLILLGVFAFLATTSAQAQQDRLRSIFDNISIPSLTSTTATFNFPGDTNDSPTAVSIPYFLIPFEDLETQWSKYIRTEDQEALESIVGSDSRVAFPVHPTNARGLKNKLIARFGKPSGFFRGTRMSSTKTFVVESKDGEALRPFFLKLSDVKGDRHVHSLYVEGSVAGSDLLRNTNVNTLPETFGAALIDEDKNIDDGFLVRSATPTKGLRKDTWTLPLHAFIRMVDSAEHHVIHRPGNSGVMGMPFAEMTSYNFNLLPEHNLNELNGATARLIHEALIHEGIFLLAPHSQNLWIEFSTNPLKIHDVFYQDMADLMIDPWIRQIRGKTPVIPSDFRIGEGGLSLAYRTEVDGTRNPFVNMHQWSY